MRKSTLHLTPHEIRFFRKNGYLILDRITTRSEIDFVQRTFLRLVEEYGLNLHGSPRQSARQPRSMLQLSMPVLEAPVLVDTILRANAVGVARQLLGPEARFVGEQAMCKPAHHMVKTPWHQDEAYWDGGCTYHALTVWVPLQDTDVRNGCLWVLPRTHRSEVLPHHPVDSAAEDRDLEVDHVDATTAVACPVKVGGAFVHSPRLLHASGTNQTDTPRWAYALGCSLMPVHRETPRDFYWNRLTE